MKRQRLLILGTWLVALAGALAAPAMADDDRGRDRDRHHRYDRDHDRDWRDDDRRGRDRDRRWRGDDDRHWRVHWDDDDRHWRDDHRRHGYSHWDRSDPRRVVYVGPPVYRPVYRHYRPVYRHYGPPPWARGRHYRYHGYAPTYVVHDYRPYRLYAPPRGHYWRRSDAGDFLLVAIATGIIADVVLNH